MQSFIPFEDYLYVYEDDRCVIGSFVQCLDIFGEYRGRSNKVPPQNIRNEDTATQKTSEWYYHLKYINNRI